MNCTRRTFLALSGVLAAGAARPALARRLLIPAGEVFTWESVSERVRVAFGAGGNAMVVSGTGGSLLVDCKNPGYGDALRREAGDPAVVINTHHHFDHTGGNYAFAPDVPLLAHAGCKPRIAEQTDRYIQAIASFGRGEGPADTPDAIRADAARRTGEDAPAPEDFLPTRLMEQSETVRVGGTEVHLRHIGPGHTDNDVFVHIPELNLVHTGDLLFHKSHPYIDRPAGASTKGWINSVRQIIKLCDDETVVVPGHGEITDVHGLEAQIAYFEHIHALVAAAIDAGKTREEIQKDAIEKYSIYERQQIRPLVLGVVYDELTQD